MNREIQRNPPPKKKIKQTKPINYFINEGPKIVWLQMHSKMWKKLILLLKNINIIDRLIIIELNTLTSFMNSISCEYKVYTCKMFAKS